MVLAAVLGRIFLKTVPSFPAMRRTSANLVATRGESPKVWLVAHTDSKSQTIPMLVRIGSFVLGTGSCLALLLWLLRYRFGVMIPDALATNAVVSEIVFLTVVAVLSLLPFTLCFISDRSPGALDNASGVAAVLLAADMMAPGQSLGVLLTSGEELALAGARAFTAGRSDTAVAINCDTIDDAGQFACMRSSRLNRAASALARVAGRYVDRVRTKGIPGILTDGVAFAEAGWDVCTLSRGNLGTLARVHTASDTSGRIDGTGIALAARILAATVEELA